MDILPVRFSHRCQWLGQARIHAVEARVDGQTTGGSGSGCRRRRADAVDGLGTTSLVTQLLLSSPLRPSIAEPHLQFQF